ncbi:MAG TPA: hypothetical protein ENJ11_07975 [Gammaproteobacteria bacterium]|nr:hypothetical protein [Gammaproteobacteria bacterium]
MSIFCYSQKILNPFRGVMNIISIGGADAVTIDGINWTLYIHDNFDCPIDDPEEFFEIEMPDIRFGDWSREDGFRASPLIASYHYNEIQAIGHVLLEALDKHADECPFPFNDKYELWLLDRENDEPLALLASVCQKEEIFTPENLSWEAGLRCKQEFLRDYPLADSEVDCAGELLNRLINQRAGDNPSAQWFFRDELNDGTGMDGINLDQRLHGRKLSSRMFPKMLVQRYWQNHTESSLFNDFISWLSPYLLVLDYLRDRQREALEQTARQHALLVDRLYLLYPKIINRQAINAARVEARLRKSV